MSNHRRALPIEKRVEILQDLKKKIPVKTIAEKNGVLPSTIHRIKHNAANILEFVEQGDNLRYRKTLKKWENEKLESQLYSWYLQQKIFRKPLTDAIMLRHAIELNKTIPESKEFRTSRGWLNNFKARHNIDRDTINNHLSEEELRIAKSHPNFARKPKRKALSIEDRVQLLEDLKQNVPINTIANKYNVLPRTITRIKSNEANIMEFSKKAKNLKYHRSLKAMANEALECELYTWYLERQRLQMPLTDTLLLNHALELTKKFPTSKGFRTSKSWLARFKQRHNIVRLFAEEEEEKEEVDDEEEEEMEIIIKEEKEEDTLKDPIKDSTIGEFYIEENFDITDDSSNISLDMHVEDVEEEEKIGEKEAIAATIAGEVDAASAVIIKEELNIVDDGRNVSSNFNVLHTKQEKQNEEEKNKKKDIEQIKYHLQCLKSHARNYPQFITMTIESLEASFVHHTRRNIKDY